MEKESKNSEISENRNFGSRRAPSSAVLGCPRLCPWQPSRSPRPPRPSSAVLGLAPGPEFSKNALCGQFGHIGALGCILLKFSLFFDTCHVWGSFGGNSLNWRALSTNSLFFGVFLAFHACHKPFARNSRRAATSRAISGICTRAMHYNNASPQFRALCMELVTLWP